MWLLDIFRIKKMKSELEELKKIKLSKDEIKYLDLKTEYDRLNYQYEKLIEAKNFISKEIPMILEIKDLLEKQRELQEQLNHLSSKKDTLIKEVVDLEDKIEIQSYGAYEYKYDMENSDLYLIKLKEVQEKQKHLIKTKKATNHSLLWSIEGDHKKGKTFILNTIKLCLRAFNTEADNIILNAKYNNINKCQDTIIKRFTEINELVKMQKVSIKREYLNLKLEQLYLKYEYEMKKHQEKIEQEEIKERMREEMQAEKEIEAMQKKLDKEELHYTNALNELKDKVNQTSETEKKQIERKISEIEKKLENVLDNKKTVQERLENTRAGYVYVISNIGSFGEDVYKIGMTRRLQPQDRVNELGDASVPFKFDVHAMIFADDAPSLEAKIHKVFRNREVNKINHRKEFFRVSLEEIESVVKNNFDKPVTFIRTALAEEYRESIALEKLQNISEKKKQKCHMRKSENNPLLEDCF